MKLFICCCACQLRALLKKATVSRCRQQMATEHLLEPQLRQLVKHCIEQKLLSIGSFLETGHVKQTQFRAWRNRDVPSGSAVKAARQRCDEYFANNALPAQFAAQDAQAED